MDARGAGGGARSAACRLAVAGLLLLLAHGCASDASRPWHVPKGREGRFREASRVCHQLTDRDDGTVERKRFDACMQRRGWRRQRWTDRIGIGLLS